MKHKINFVKESLSIGECICCHKRSDRIVIGDGRCTDCIYTGRSNDLPEKTLRNQRDYALGALNMTLGMCMIVFAMKVLGHHVPKDIPQIILWFVGICSIVGLIIHIRNLIKKS